MCVTVVGVFGVLCAVVAGVYCLVYVCVVVVGVFDVLCC